MSDFSGKIYGINPNYSDQTSPPTPLLLGGGSQCSIYIYKDIASLPETPDIAVFAIPAEFVADSLRECGKK